MELGNVAQWGTLGVALWAPWRWRALLRETRADECLSAIYDFEGSVGKLRAVKPRMGRLYWMSVDEAYKSGRNVRKAFEVARRYHRLADLRSLSGDLQNRLKSLLDAARRRGRVFRQ